MKILTFTSLFPNVVMPTRGVFVENRLRHLLSDTDIQSVVVAPVPWFPFAKYFLSEYKEFSLVPKKENRYSVQIYHPRYFHVPKVGMVFQPFSMALSGYFLIKKIINEGYDFNLIDAHYFYPDGVAAALIAGWLNKPFLITARGTDLNLIPNFRIPKRLIKYAANKANALITVCRALKDVLVDMGVQDDKVVPLRNGVDLEMFKPSVDREQLQKKLKLKGKTIISVGYLIERKGHNYIIEALQHLPDVNLLIAGSGPEEVALKALALSVGVSDRVTFLGTVGHDELREYYSAVDIMVLASSREGWANVLLESMACGTPVVATNIWGTPEVVATPDAGVLVERDAESIASGISKLYANYPDRMQTRKYAEQFSWLDTSLGQQTLFSSVLNS